MSHSHNRAQGAALAQRKKDGKVYTKTTVIAPGIKQRVAARIAARQAANDAKIAQIIETLQAQNDALLAQKSVEEKLSAMTTVEVEA